MGESKKQNNGRKTAWREENVWMYVCICRYMAAGAAVVNMERVLCYSQIHTYSCTHSHRQRHRELKGPNKRNKGQKKKEVYEKKHQWCTCAHAASCTHSCINFESLLLPLPSPSIFDLYIYGEIAAMPTSHSL